MPPTLRDVATAAGVHPGTASRAMNPSTAHLVNAATAKRVRKVADELGYVPNPIARSLKTSRSSTLGILIPDITNPLFPPIIRGFEDAVSAQGYSVLIANTDNVPERETAQIRDLKARQAEGILVATARATDDEVRSLVAEGSPIVLVNRVMTDTPACNVVGDDASGVAQAVDHLVGLGHTRIGHVTGPQDTSTGRLRLRAFRNEVAERGIDLGDDAIVQADAYQVDEGRRATEELLDRCQVTAVLAGNDLLALGALDALAARGLRCPHDVSVVGFNDIPLMDRVHPPLTTVRLPHYELGVESGRLMLEMLADREASRRPKSVSLPLSLVVRESTAPARTA